MSALVREALDAGAFGFSSSRITAHRTADGKVVLGNPSNPNKWRSTIEMTGTAQATGAQLYPQISMRPTGIVMGLQSSFHMFMGRPSYDALTALPFEKQVERLSSLPFGPRSYRRSRRNCRSRARRCATT